MDEYIVRFHDELPEGITQEMKEACESLLFAADEALEKCIESRRLYEGLLRIAADIETVLDDAGLTYTEVVEDGG